MGLRPSRQLDGPLGVVAEQHSRISDERTNGFVLGSLLLRRVVDLVEEEINRFVELGKDVERITDLHVDDVLVAAIDEISSIRVEVNRG